MLGITGCCVHPKKAEGGDSRSDVQGIKPYYIHELGLYKLSENCPKETQTLYLRGCAGRPENIAALS